MTERLLIRVDEKNEQHIHCSVFEGNGTYALNGKLIFSPNMFYSFTDALRRGMSGRVEVLVKE